MSYFRKTNMKKLTSLVKKAFPLFSGVLLAGNLHAAGEVSTVQTRSEPATPFQYSVDGQTFLWGAGTNQIMEGFVANGLQFDFASTADRVSLQRDNVADVAVGNPCGVFVERFGAASDVLNADYPSDGSDTGNCDMAELIASRVINRGALNLFSNIGPNPNNIERVDHIFDFGLLAPLSKSAMNAAGHVVAEKSGNNPIQIAAIKELSIFGEPLEYGPLVRIHGNGCSGDNLCYGVTDLRHNYTFFQNSSLTPQGFATFLKDSTESVGIAFVSATELGLEAGERYYGFSYFPEDVDETLHVLTDPSTFPDDTQDENILFGDGADIYGGVSGYYLANTINTGSGSVFLDENEDGQRDDTEAGISDISLTVFADSDRNGEFDPAVDEQLGSTFISDMTGNFVLPGLPDGQFFLVLDEDDADLPPGLGLPEGSNPLPFSVDGGAPNDLNFSFVNIVDAADTDNSDTGSGNDADQDAGDGSNGDADQDGIGGGNDQGDGSNNDNDQGDGLGDEGDQNTDTGSGDGDPVDQGDNTNGQTDSGDQDGINNNDTGSGGDDFIVINDGDNSDSGNDGAAANMTMANPDAVSVAQGSTILVDVLANDIDATGNGLTLVSVSDTTNATVVILDGQISYTPDFGFTGPDSFLYVIEDSAGTQATGTVSAEVTRFSDINNNGLNDFDECNCDNLTIEVGVEGSALGGTSLQYLVLLLAFIGVRRFRKPLAGCLRASSSGDAQ